MPVDRERTDLVEAAVEIAAIRIDSGNSAACASRPSKSQQARAPSALHGQPLLTCVLPLPRCLNQEMWQPRRAVRRSPRANVRIIPSPVRLRELDVDSRLLVHVERAALFSRKHARLTVGCARNCLRRQYWRRRTPRLCQMRCQPAGHRSRPPWNGRGPPVSHAGRRGTCPPWRADPSPRRASRASGSNSSRRCAGRSCPCAAPCSSRAAASPPRRTACSPASARAFGRLGAGRPPVIRPPAP